MHQVIHLPIYLSLFLRMYGLIHVALYMGSKVDK